MKFFSKTAYLWLGMSVGAVFQFPLILAGGGDGFVQAAVLAVAGPLAVIGFMSRRVRE